MEYGKFNPKATFTFFGSSGCGHCRHFKGETIDKAGNSKISPNGAWEVLRNDKDLYFAGVEFVPYIIGTVKDPATGKIKQYKLEPGYEYIRGFPHFELSAPGKPFEGLQFEERVRSWDSKECVPIMKAWILRKLKEDPRFKNSVKGEISVAPKPAANGQPAPIYMQQPPTRIETGAGNENNVSTEISDKPNQPEPIRLYQQPTVKIAQPPPTKQNSLVPAQSTFNVEINKNKSKAPTVFGLGTRQIAINDSVVPNPGIRKKAPPRFLPANYDL